MNPAAHLTNTMSPTLPPLSTIIFHTAHKKECASRRPTPSVLPDRYSRTSPIDDLDNIHQLGEGWVAEETLGISLYCALRHQDNFSAGVIAAVNHSGDSDSTGAVTGNILGALLGYDSIDDQWKKGLDLEQYKQSWEMILQKNSRMLYPGHGKPFRTSDLQKYLNSLDRVKLRPL